MKLVLILITLYGVALAQTATPAFTGEIGVEGADILPSGKFATLRVNVGVETPGGYCSLAGSILGEAGETISFQNAKVGSPLPLGKGVIKLDFPGAKIAQRGIDGPLIVSGLSLTCQEGLMGLLPTVDDRRRHTTSVVRASDFDDRAPDFEFIPDETVPAASGDRIFAGVRIHQIGAFDSPITLSARADAPLETHLLNPWQCPAGEPCWATGASTSLSIAAPADIPDGKYDVELTGRGGGKEHTVHLQVVIDPALTRRKQQYLKAVEALKREDAEPPPDPPSKTAVRLAPKNETPPAAQFFSEVDLRKIHAVLVLDRSTSMFATCEYLKAAAIQFANLFIEGRDSVGIIDYGLSVDKVLPLTDQFKVSAREGVSKMQCIGATNTGDALEAAQAELAAHEDPEAIDAVILFTDGVPNVLTANWPVQMPAHGCRGHVYCATPPKICVEAQSGQVAGTLMPTYSFEFEPSGLSLADELKGDIKKKWSEDSCFGATSLGNFAYLPEVDLQGVPVTGSHPVERYTAGPHVGKIRLDSMETVLNAILNQVENAARRMSSDLSHPAFLYVVGFQNPIAADSVKSLAQLQSLANDPRAPSFEPKQNPGLAILIDDPEQFWPALQRVRQEIVKRAALK